jgi:hypothetical protein
MILFTSPVSSTVTTSARADAHLPEGGGSMVCEASSHCWSATTGLSLADNE